jgi:protein-S-isoprenylcysteine O-methyltransferase Ste14
MKTHILATISVLSFIGIFFWAFFDEKSFVLVIIGISGVALLIFMYALAYTFWRRISDPDNPKNNDDRYL